MRFRAETEVSKEEMRIRAETEEMRIRAETEEMRIRAEVSKEEMRIRAETEVAKEQMRISAETTLLLKKLHLNDRLSAFIPFYNWTSLLKENITYHTDMEFAELEHLLKVAFSLQSDFRIYSLPPNALIENRERVDNETFRAILKPFVHITGENLPTLYVFSGDYSPVKLPENTSKLQKVSSRSSTSQGSLRDTVINRDAMCVFCGDTSSTLAAAHILDHHRATPQLIDSLGLMGVNDYKNAISLCVMCHRFFDGHMFCIDPMSLSLIICEAFLACSPFRERYIPLNGKRVNFPDNAFLLQNYPHYLVLKDRYDHFMTRSAERRKKNAERPYYCFDCNKRWKTEKGRIVHVCKLGHNSTTSSHVVANYSSPQKIYIEDDPDPGVDDDDIY
jgi:hypothetical protein